MDFSLTEEQEMLKTMARDFLEKECPVSLVRDMEVDETGYSAELWRKMAELGWLGLPFPEEYGGSGGSFLDLTILLEEIGRAMVPGPFIPTVIHCGLPILEAGSDEQKHNFLPGIASGDIIMTMALAEPEGAYTADSIETSAVLAGSDYMVSGTKLLVPFAHVAQHLLSVVKTDSGITLLLADAGSTGLNLTPLITFASDKQF